jgi:hypothetical protein
LRELRCAIEAIHSEEISQSGAAFEQAPDLMGSVRTQRTLQGEQEFC